MFQVDGYRVDFSHNIKGRVTMCVITMPNGVTHLEAAMCSPLDNFSRAPGRKVALTKALKFYNKEQRRKFWNKYWELSHA